jgi:hypothetical protein
MNTVIDNPSIIATNGKTDLRPAAELGDFLTVTESDACPECAKRQAAQKKWSSENPPLNVEGATDQFRTILSLGIIVGQLQGYGDVHAIPTDTIGVQYAISALYRIAQQGDITSGQAIDTIYHAANRFSDNWEDDPAIQALTNAMFDLAKEYAQYAKPGKAKDVAMSIDHLSAADYLPEPYASEFVARYAPISKAWSVAVEGRVADLIDAWGEHAIATVVRMDAQCDNRDARLIGRIRDRGFTAEQLTCYPHE